MVVQSFIDLSKNKLKRSIKWFDRYPKTIGFTYKGSEGFSTLFGGWYSIILMIFLLTYSSFLFIVMVNRGASKTSKTTRAVDLKTNPDEHQPGLHNVFIGFIVTDYVNASAITLDPTVYEFEANQVSATPGSSGANFSFTPIEIELWGSKVDEYDPDGYLELTGYRESLYWLKDDNYTLRGNSGSNPYKYLEIKVKSWK